MAPIGAPRGVLDLPNPLEERRVGLGAGHHLGPGGLFFVSLSEATST